MATLSAYLRTWWLKLSLAEMMTVAFYLHNREAKRELKVYANGQLLPLFSVPTYLGVKMDRPLTFRHHLETFHRKPATRVLILRRPAGSEWGADAKTLRTAALSLVYSTAEYCAPVWCGSAHTRLIDSVLKDVLHIVTGCVCHTPTDNLPVVVAVAVVAIVVVVVEVVVVVLVAVVVVVVVVVVLVVVVKFLSVIFPIEEMAVVTPFLPQLFELHLFPFCSILGILLL